MLVISASQCRAARGLLKWSQPDLSARAGVNVQTISAFEKESATPTKRTLQKLTMALEIGGVEFMENDGVQRKSNNILVLRGHDGFTKFRHLVLTEAKAGPIDICVSNVNERDFSKWGAPEMNAAYRNEIAKIPHVRFRIMVQEGDTFFSARKYAEYRHVKSSEFGNIPLYVFRNITAIFSFEENNLNIFIIEHAGIASFHLKMFETNWEKATPAIIDNENTAP